MKKTNLLIAAILTGILSWVPGKATAESFERAQEFLEPVENRALTQLNTVAEVQKLMTLAMLYHEVAFSLRQNIPVITDSKKTIDDYHKLLETKAEGYQCNVDVLSKNFSDPQATFERLMALGRDYNAPVKEKYKSLEEDKSDKEKSEIGKLNPGNESVGDKLGDMKEGESVDEDELGSMIDQTGGSSESQLSGLNEGSVGQEVAEEKQKLAQEAHRARWQVGVTVLKDLYKNQDKWGSATEKFVPWLDQDRISWTVPLEDMQKHYARFNVPEADEPPEKPEDYKDYPKTLVEYQKAMELVKIENCKKDEKVEQKKTDENGNEIEETEEVDNPDYPKACKDPKLKNRVFAAPEPIELLPPWREIVYVGEIDEENPGKVFDSVYTGTFSNGQSVLPQPWRLITSSNYPEFPLLYDRIAQNPKGEFEQMFVVSGNTITFRGDDDNTKTQPTPSTVNRISAFLSLEQAEIDKKPDYEAAVARINAMNVQFGQELQNAKKEVSPTSAEYVLTNYTLENESDYNLTITSLREAQDHVIERIKKTMASVRVDERVKSAEDVFKIGNDVIAALEKDRNFLVLINNDNALKVESLMKEDDAASELKARLATESANMEEGVTVEGYVTSCPVLVKFVEDDPIEEEVPPEEVPPEEPA